MAFWNKKKKEEAAPASDAANAPARPAPVDLNLPAGLSNVKNIIAVASGKGGVGKSTVSTNLAVALHQLGYKVGLMDADIYGPSQPGMMGAAEARPKAQGNNIVPVQKFGVSFMSMGLLTGSDAPVVWRAPIATRVIQQFLNNVNWGELDYLLIDLPPGTGDIQLTLAQQASLTGAVIVSTPQQVALGIAQKGLKMFQQVNIPILGIVENMSGFCCPNCGHETKVFKGGGGSELAVGLEVPFLGSIPLDPKIMMAGDNGIPVLVQDQNSAPADAFRGVASGLEAQVKSLQDEVEAVEPTHIDHLEDGMLRLEWHDGYVATFDPYTLRVHCRCALCVEETTGEQILDPSTVALDIKLTSYRKTGRYALSLAFSDGHKSGIYQFTRLREMSENSPQEDSFSV